VSRVHRSGGFGGGYRLSQLRPSGGYRDSCSFQTATIVYDATYWFCEKYLDPRSRTVDQMVQAARSGRQNIAEGSRATATSSQTELRLVNVARASLDELLLDYEDYLRQHALRQWSKDDAQAREVRAVGKKRTTTEQTDQADAKAYVTWLNHKDPAVVANTIICLIHQANYLLDLQISGLEQQFVEDGGYSEQLAAKRIEKRKRDLTDPTEKEKPFCPLCKGLMVLRIAKKGSKTGFQFWGCAGYPKCKGTLQSVGSDRSAGVQS
jgi:restriction system protein